MGNAVPAQQPAVVLRSHFKHLRALLAVALIAVAGLTAAVVILANDDDLGSSAGSAGPQSMMTPQEKARVEALSSLSAAELGSAFGNGRATLAPDTRYDGGPEEGTRGILPNAEAPVTGSRYDGGPDEGTRGPFSYPGPIVNDPTAPGVRYDGGPEEGTRGPGFRTN